MKPGTAFRARCVPLVLGLAVSCATMATTTMIVDGDADGVADEADRCLYTPLGIRVRGDGCSPLAGDEDEDAVADLTDACPLSPAGARVDAQGCALDGDIDGIADGIDHCPSTGSDRGVDEAGCAPGDRRVVLAMRAPRAAEPSIAVQDAAWAPRLAAIPSPLPPLGRLPPPMIQPQPTAPPLASREPPKPAEPLPAAMVPEPEPRPAPPPVVAAEQPPIGLQGVPARGIDANPQLPGQRYLTLYFNPGSVELTEDSLTILRRQPSSMNAELTRRPQANLIVVGHADPRSDGDRPMLAAARRAESVHRQLVQLGVPGGRMTVRSDGVNGPRFAGAELGRNRRVELYLYDPVSYGQRTDTVAAVSVSSGLGSDAMAAVAFSPNSTLLDSTATRALDSFFETMVPALRPDGSVRVRIGGSADPGEAAVPEATLARGRALAVRSYLMSIGLKQHLVEIDTVPGTRRQEAYGRRAEVRLVGMAGG
ncbi:MAG: OmpA family protein [Panacagrimonas sp.]